MKIVEKSFSFLFISYDTHDDTFSVDILVSHALASNVSTSERENERFSRIF